MIAVVAGPVSGSDRESVTAFLRNEGYSQPIQPADELFAAWSGSEVVGAVRLALESGVVVLRGMRVQERLRRQGIGSQLLGRLDVAIGNTTCWCIPYSWLTEFYASIGFMRSDVGETPTFLVERHRQYVQEGLDVVVMVRRRNDDVLKKG